MASPKPGEWLSVGGGPGLNLLFLQAGPPEDVDFRVPRPRLAVSDFQDAASFLVYGTLPFLPPASSSPPQRIPLHSGRAPSQVAVLATTGTN